MIEHAIALAIFAASYVALGLGRVPGLRVDRTGVALIGAAAMVVGGGLGWEDAVRSVDAHTLVLAITSRLQLPPVPYLMALATAANVGSVATLTGNPQNMLVGSFSSLTYRGFLAREAPIALLGLGVVFLVVRVVYRRQLPDAFATTASVARYPVHYPLMIKTLIAVGAMLVAFLAGVPIALVAIAGAAYSLLTRRVKPDKVYREVNWGLLVLFVGLFVLTGGLEQSDAGDELGRWTARLGLHRPLVLTVTAAIVSNLVSNVPAVLLFKPLLAGFGEPDRAWLILAMASTLAGNLTLIGSVANLIVAEAARDARVEIGFLEYCRVGVPLTIVTLLVGWAVLVLVPV